MKSTTLLLAIVLSAGSLGCGTFLTDTARNLSEAPVRGVDDAHLKKDIRREALEAWRGVVRDNPDKHFSADYADGFKAGFADYLYEGGDGLPPAVPPFRYQLGRYATPEGHQAIVQWYEGFTEGSAEAKASGGREQIVIPLSAPPINVVNRRSGGATAPLNAAESLPEPTRLLRSAPPESPPGAVEILPPRGLDPAPLADVVWRRAGG